MKEGWREALSAALRGDVLFDEPLASRVAFKIGGPADAFVRARNAEALARALLIADEYAVPVTMLGTGSNVLVSDDGVRGMTLRLSGELASVTVEPPLDGVGRVRVGAGALNAPVVAEALSSGLVGIEFLATIPGTFGGALIMNAGAHGGEIGAFVSTVSLLDAKRESVVRTRDQCGFRYRGSEFLRDEVLTAAVLEIPEGDVAKARDHLLEMRRRRRASQPISEPNAGSIFKNPTGDHAGRLIEACGLKGRRFGQACISIVHANFIVNLGGATARDVKLLAAMAQATVRERFGLELEWEVKRLGD